jgi:hypothetical protein
MKRFTLKATVRLACFIFLSITLLSSCKKDFIRGSGHVVSETRSVGNFTDVEIFGPFEVQLISANTPGIEIRAEDNVISAIETGVRDNSLFIRIRSSVHLRSHLPIRVYVSNSTFQRAKFNGSGTLTCKDTIKTSLFKYEVNGSAVADLAVKTDNLYVTVNGSGYTTLGGACKNLNGTINGSGNVDAWDLPTPVADVTINGSGEFRVLASEHLTARIRGSGTIRFKGTADLESDIQGSGRVIR